MYIVNQPKAETAMKISVDYSSEAGKLGRHTLSFRTGAMKDRKKAARKYACRNKGRFQREDF